MQWLLHHLLRRQHRPSVRGRVERKLGQTESVKALLAAGATANQVESQRVTSPLLMAAQDGHGECVKALLAAGATAHQVNPQNGTFP